MAADQLEFTDSARGCGIFIGLVSIVVNGGMAFAGALIMSRGQLGGIALAALGGIGVLFGMVLAFGRYSAHLDRDKHMLVKSWRIGFEVRRRETSLAGYTTVVLRNHLARMRYGWHRFHTVSLVGEAGELALRRLDLDDEAQAFAHRVAEFLGWPMHDQRLTTPELMAARPRLSGRGRFIVVGVTAIMLLVITGVVGVVVALQNRATTKPPRRQR